jgi:hypothetical protein
VIGRKIPLSSRKVEDSKDKIEHYRKLIDKKIGEISNSSINKNLNKSSITGTTPDSNNRSSSNHSFLTKDKSKK